ncbi:MAG: 2-oxoglutarate dehydrogenase complex dihydrolipoyllysine-residue succinyltransferase [Hymenobacteraceae bacterium]|nr:2-oxoglutarate dehydrogenase complex dihydrolipoyllysine-residue succinyltransferase [Hymenobacteraceae bacterium]
MALEVKIPTVGESITEVTIAKWLKKDGDTVQRDELIGELESDKATFELPAEGAGVLRLRAAEGDTIGIGTVIAEIDGAATGAAPVAPAPAAAVMAAAPLAALVAPAQAVAAGASVPAAAPASGGTYEMKVPTVGESITEVTVAKWLKKDGDTVQRDELIAELESDKATFELPTEAAGTLRLAVAEGATVPIGGLLARIEGATTGAASAPATPAIAPATATPVSGTSYANGVPSPAAGKILDEKGIPTSAVSGTGRDGRITKEDALNAQPAPAVPVAPALATPPAAAQSASQTAQVAAAGGRAERREKMTSLRRTVARRLVAVKNETAMLTTFNEVDMQPIMELRAKYKDKFKEKHGVGLGFMSFFTKAVCVALKEFPAVNAQLDGQDIIYHDYCDVSIAVSAPKGLVVPVIRNAEAMSFDEIEKEVVRLATRARDSKLTLEEMSGGTFTITNGGVFGSMLSTPIINAPQSAILGMHNIVERPMAVGGQVVIRPIMYLALSYDHRIIDGRESVSFLVRVKQLLEEPTRLLLGV